MVHRHNPSDIKPDIPDRCWPVILRAVQRSESVPVVSDYDIPYLCGYSKDGQTVFKDRHAPDKYLKYWKVHEIVEKDLMDHCAMDYEHAHPIAEYIEELQVSAAGIDLTGYRAENRRLVAEAAKRKITHTPRILDIRPYRDEHDQKDVIAIQQAMDAKQLVTRNKQQWAKQYKHTGTMAGTPLHYNHADERAYRARLDRLIERMVTTTEREINRLFSSETAEAHYATDESISSRARILTNKLQRQFEQLFSKSAGIIAQKVVDDAKASSKANLHSSLKELSGGLSLKTDVMTGRLQDVLTASVAENVGLIKSIPGKYFDQIQGALMRSITYGDGLKDLIPALEKYRGITYRRARMIARDQTRKVYSSVNLARMNAIGIKQAKWLHSSGSNEPRKSHIAMNGKVFDLDKGMWDPEVEEWIHPAELPNCRCTYVPVLVFDDGEHE